METKKSIVMCIAIAIALIATAGCTYTGPDFEIDEIDTPSAVRHFEWEPLENPDNLARHQLGATLDSLEIIEITELGAMRSYPHGGQMYMPDLSGVAFTSDINNQWGWGPFGDKFGDMTAHMYILEFTFPEATYQNGTNLSWSVTPHMRCTYQIDCYRSLIEEGEDVSEAWFWIDYVILEDPHGMYDLMETDPNLMVAVLAGNIDPEDRYSFAGDSDGWRTMTAYDDERSGVMFVPQGVEAKLFVGVSVLTTVYERGDRIRIGGNSLPTTTGDPNRCTFDFGTTSFYIMSEIDE